MTKKEFMKQLRTGLDGYNESEIDEIVADYEEHFQVAFETGKSEEDICASLGSPVGIAKAYNVENLLKSAKDDKKWFDYLKAFLVFISLGILNLVFVFFPVMGLIGTLLGAWMVPLACFGFGIAGVLAPFIIPFLDHTNLEIVGFTFLPNMTMILAGTGTIALGILTMLFLWWLTKWFFRMLLKYIEVNINLIKKLH